MDSFVGSLKIDQWYKTVLFLGGALLVVSLTVDLNGLASGLTFHIAGKGNLKYKG